MLKAELELALAAAKDTIKMLRSANDELAMRLAGTGNVVAYVDALRPFASQMIVDKMVSAPSGTEVDVRAPLCAVRAACKLIA